MTLADYFSLLSVMTGVWLSMDIVVFCIKKAVHLFKIVSK